MIFGLVLVLLAFRFLPRVYGEWSVFRDALFSMVIGVGGLLLFLVVAVSTLILMMP